MQAREAAIRAGRATAKVLEEDVAGLRVAAEALEVTTVVHGAAEADPEATSTTRLHLVAKKRHLPLHLLLRQPLPLHHQLHRLRLVANLEEAGERSLCPLSKTMVSH